MLDHCQTVLYRVNKKLMPEGLVSLNDVCIFSHTSSIKLKKTENVLRAGELEVTLMVIKPSLVIMGSCT